MLTHMAVDPKAAGRHLDSEQNVHFSFPSISEIEAQDALPKTFTKNCA